jgi:hypothetical protein
MSELFRIPVPSQLSLVHVFGPGAADLNVLRDAARRAASAADLSDRGLDAVEAYLQAWWTFVMAMRSATEPQRTRSVVAFRWSSIFPNGGEHAFTTVHWESTMTVHQLAVMRFKLARQQQEQGRKEAWHAKYIKGELAIHGKKEIERKQGDPEYEPKRTKATELFKDAYANYGRAARLWEFVRDECLARWLVKIPDSTESVDKPVRETQSDVAESLVYVARAYARSVVVDRGDLEDKPTRLLAQVEMGIAALLRDNRTAHVPHTRIIAAMFEAKTMQRLARYYHEKDDHGLAIALLDRALANPDFPRNSDMYAQTKRMASDGRRTYTNPVLKQDDPALETAIPEPRPFHGDESWPRYVIVVKK